MVTLRVGIYTLSTERQRKHSRHNHSHNHRHNAEAEAHCMSSIASHGLKNLTAKDLLK